MIVYAIIGAAAIIAVLLYFRLQSQRKKLLATLPKNKYRIVEYKEPKEYMLYIRLDTGQWKYVHEYKTYQSALSGAVSHQNAKIEDKKTPRSKRRKKIVHTI